MDDTGNFQADAQAYISSKVWTDSCEVRVAGPGSRVQAERDPYRSSPIVRLLAPRRARTPAYHKKLFSLLSRIHSRPSRRDIEFLRA